MKTIDQKIASHPFLKEMKPEHLAILGRHAREVEFAAGQTIFHESDSAYQFYLILQGKVAVESYVPRGDNMLLQTIEGGDVLGWSWLFPPFTWHFQARALEPTKAVFIDGASLLVACEQEHDFGCELMERIAQVVIQRLQATRKRFLEIQKTSGSLPPAEEIKSVPTCCEQPGQSLEAMLAVHPFLKGMRAEHLKILAGSAMKAQFDAAEVIFREGDLGNRFYLIQRGKVVLEAAGADNAAVPIQIIGPGDVLGWSWLFPPFYWHFDARALEPTESIFLYGTRLREQCETDRDFGYELMKRVCLVLIQRLQTTRKQLLELERQRVASGKEGAANHKGSGVAPELAAIN